MVDGRHVGIFSKCHNSTTDGPTGTQLGWSHSIVSPTCPPWCGCHGDSRYLPTAHWTFCSYGRLEAECVNQFWWNSVHNSTLWPQWQSHDQILKFLKFKVADGRHDGKYWHTITHLAMDLLGRNLAGRIPSRSRHVHQNGVALATAVA